MAKNGDIKQGNARQASCFTNLIDAKGHDHADERTPLRVGAFSLEECDEVKPGEGFQASMEQEVYKNYWVM